MVRNRKLKWFLVEYDRHEGKLRNLTEYAEPEGRAAAWERLKELEASQWDELLVSVKAGVPLRMEYVLLVAESEEAIRVTHGNYFGDDDLTLAQYLEIKRAREKENSPELAPAGVAA